MLSEFFTGRNTVSAQSLKGPRVYSTDLLPGHLDRARISESVLQATRALKIKIIAKGLVALNSCHLADPFGVHLCMAHPDVLAGDAILPAFRADDQSLAALATASPEEYAALGISEKNLADHLHWLDKQVVQVMPWELADVGEQLRARLLTGLSSEVSSVSKFLRAAQDGEAWRGRIISSIEKVDMARDRHMQEVMQALPGEIRDRVLAFYQASYHAVGTTVVNCETGTDLSPVSAFKAESLMLANRDTPPADLTEEAIFLQAFLGYALDQIQSFVLPTQIVDAISFYDVHRLSRALRESGFQEKYQSVVEAAASASQSTDACSTIEDIDFAALAHVSAEIAGTFQTYLDQEFERYNTKELDLVKGEAMQSTTDIGLDALAAIPGPGSLVTLAKMGIQGAKAVGMSARAFDLRDNEKAFAAARERRNAEIAAVIGGLKVGGSKRAQLLDATAALSDIYSIRTRRA